MKDLLKKSNYFNKNRVIILSVLSIFLVITLLLGSTYSLFSATNIDEDLHVYTTGNLNITYTLSEDNIIFDKPTTYSIKESSNVVPYRITINNIGNVAYKFNLILDSDTAVNSIDFQYIMTRVGKLDPISLSDCTDNIIKEDIIIGPNESVIVDVRVWISDTLQNSEIGKSFYAKLKVDGIAVHNDYKKEDNSLLRADYPLLNEMSAGSYVKYIGNNGCANGNCDGTNANSSSTSNGWCDDQDFEYNSKGWRIAYISNNNTYLTSGGVPECLATDTAGNPSSTTVSASDSTDGLTYHIANLQAASLKYCNAGFAYNGICNNNSSWFFSSSDFSKITGGTLGVGKCFQSTITTCGNLEGVSGDLIKNGGYYWINHLYDDSSNTSYYRQTLFTFANLSISHHFTKFADGVRPVIKLDSSVIVTKGTGTEKDPYIIENPNTIKDLSGNMNNGAISGAIWDKKNGVITTDGIDDYINLGLKNYDFDNSISLAIKVKFNTIPVSGVGYEFFGNWDDGGGGLCLSNDKGTGPYFSFYPYIEEQSAYVPAPYSTNAEINKWYTVVGTYDGTTIKLYIDGTLVSSTSSSGNVKTSPASFGIGGNMNTTANTTNLTDATYDYALIYDRALSEDEISTHFSGNEIDNKSLDKSNLLLYYDFTTDGPTDQNTDLNKIESGKFVKYTGSNGCPGDYCKGLNANRNSTNNGYCYNETRQFNSSGWQVAYTEGNNSYIVSAGAPECMCTNSNGSTSSSSCSDYETTYGSPVHLANLNNKALTYCNKDYASGGVCNNTTTWAFNGSDFEKITEKALNSSSCFDSMSDESCGYRNSLIDNGSHYWYATSYNSSNSFKAFVWAPDRPSIFYNESAYVLGVRPVIKLDESIKVTGGSGTEIDPYRLLNIEYLNEAKVGSYVKYVGSNGCTGNACVGINANAASDNNGYCYNADRQFNNTGWRIAYIKDNSAHIVSAGAPECMCSNNSGLTSSTSCSDYETTYGAPIHFANLNNKALEYCNPEYSSGGKCDSTTTWAFNGSDFQKITGKPLTSSSCFDSASDTTCGYTNTLIDTGGHYWINSPYNSTTSSTIFSWAPDRPSTYHNNTNFVLGVRPVIKLDKSVKITEGTGTETDPYIITR